MANPTLSQIFLTILFSGTVTNPANTTSYQMVAPWGKTAVRSSLREALYNLIDLAGGENTGVLGNYLLNQIINGLTTQSSTNQPATTALSTAMTGLTSTAGLQVGQPVYTANQAYPAPNTIASITSATAIVTSQTGTVAGATTAYFGILAPLNASQLGIP